MNTNELIQIQNLSMHYGQKTALSGFDLTLHSGRIIGLLGSNGSGKTTLLKIMNGLLKNYKGSVQIDGHAPGVHTKSIISYLPDESYFPDWMHAKDAIALFKDMYADFDEEKVNALMTRMQLNKKMRIKTMSKGMKEKFQLCLVMSRKAKIYLLDEPIGGIDPAAREAILDVILNNYSEDAVVVISTHLINDIEHIFDEVVFIKEGKKTLHRNVEELRAENGKSIEELFKEVFKC